MVVALHDSPHNIHHKPTRIMVNDGSAWPSTCGWSHGAQFHTTYGLSILDHPNLPTINPQKVKPYSLKE
jgi:hypothetical protein